MALFHTETCDNCTQTDLHDCTTLHPYYFAGSIFTIIGSLTVIISYIFTPELRYHPSILIFYRSIFDLGLGLSFAALHWQPIHFLCTSHVCDNMGHLNLFLFLCIVGYFAAVLFDLYYSIKNPFSNPSTQNIVKTNITIMSCAAIISVIARWKWHFSFRDDVQYCSLSPYSTETETYNPYAIIFLYSPLVLVAILAIFVTIFAYFRLTKGLPSTFTVRQKAIRNAWTYCIIIMIYICVVGFFLFMSWINDDATKHKGIWYKLYAVTLTLFGFADFIVWIVTNYDKFKRCFVCWCCFTVKQQRHRQSTEKNDMIFNVLKPHLPQQIAIINDDILSSPNTQLIYEAYKDEEIKKSYFKKLCEKMGISVVKDKYHKTINEALRREVLAYTTDGIAQSVGNAGNGIFQEKVHYPSNITDYRSNVINKFDVKIVNNWAVTLKRKDSDQIASSNEDIDIPNRLKRGDTEFNVIKMRMCCCLRTVSTANSISNGLINVNGIAIDGVGSLNYSKTSRASKDERLLMIECNSAESGQREFEKRDVRYKKERQFVDFAPMVFKYIRNDIMGLTNDEYKQSIIPSNPREQLRVLKKCKCGEGKSGAFFYITHDNKYVVKTIKKHEVSLMLRILPDYVKYLKNNKQTILSRCVGLHSLKIYGLTKYFVVMENVFEGEYKPTEIYDLKGSWVGRFTNHEMYSGSTMKDLDLKRYVIMNETNRDNVIDQLTADTMFLQTHNIMDYSLLLGIYYMTIECNDGDDNDNKHDDDDEKEHKYEDDTKQEEYIKFAPLKKGNVATLNTTNYYLGGVRAHIIEGPGIYYFGIIDGLQSYNWKKRLETWVKTYIQTLDSKGISCVNPSEYRNRFMKYMKNIMVSEKVYKAKTKLSDKQFTTEKVSIYPSSQNIDDNLNKMGMERGMKYPSFSASKVIDRKQSVRKRNIGKNLNKQSIGVPYLPSSIPDKNNGSDLSALTGFRSDYASTARSNSLTNLLNNDS